VLFDNHFRFNPLFKAVDVDNKAGALAATGRHKEVLLVVLLNKTNLAVALKLIMDLVDSFHCSVEAALFAGENCVFGFYL
jgi:hypothetical protein